MPPLLALVLTLGFIVWLFLTDRRQIRGSSSLVVPAIWFAFVASRSPALWLNPSHYIDATSEGSPVNFTVFFLLMLAAAVILARRHFSWGALISNNKALFVIYAYFALSFLWSDFPLSSLKRIVKDFGTVMVVLVILTENDPFSAARLVIARCSFALFPLSICFIKYFPSYGRLLSKSWELMNTGVTTHKNSLGATTMVCLLMLGLDVIELRRDSTKNPRTTSLWLRYLMLLFGAWLLLLSNSKTSQVCTLVGFLILWRGKYLIRMPRPGKTIASYMAVLLVLAMLERTFDLETRFLNAIGRDASFTGRTEIWKMIGEQHINPVLGCGYLSFWDGLAAREYREEGGTEIVSTHNGYLEVYVDGGAVGCLLLAILLITAFRNIIRELTGGSAWNVACLMFLIAFLIYNYLESAFFRLGPIWFTFILIILKTPPLSWVSDESGEDIADGNALKTGVISAGNSEL
jgi:O-antigen ligase